MKAMKEYLKAALLVGAVFVAVALALELPGLGDAISRATRGGFDWAADNRWLAVTLAVLGLAVLVAAVRLDAKGGRREAHDACGGG